jgi:CRP/FNR family transcriptional regulator, nitrogen oxide reductase regulator
MEFPEIDRRRLAEQPFFLGLSDSDLQIVLEAGRTHTVAEGEYFFIQEDPAEHLYLLERGQVKLGQVTADGQQVILNVIGAGAIFGLVGFVEDSIYPASALAASDCRALSWDRPALARLAERFPRLALNAMRLMAARVNEFQGQIRTLSTERVERRLARTLLRLVRQVGKKEESGVLIDLGLSRQDLAEMCGTTLYTVSRILSQWERQGLIDAGREKVLIRSPHGLVSIAEDLPKPEG